MSPRPDLFRSRAFAIAELALAAALVVGANVYDVVPVSETPWLVLACWISLRLRHARWRELGLERPRSWPKTLAAAALAAVALQAASELVIEPVVEAITGRAADLSSFASLVGNLPATLGMLVAVWVLAAFGEELAYRGYVLDRVASLGRRSTFGYVVAMLVTSLLFGLGHLYQGVSGVAESTFSGLFFGALFLGSGRNLWLPILAHGLSDTLALGLIHFGAVELTAPIPGG